MKDRLLEEATKARMNAYAPYSVYPVGAAILGQNGLIYSGCNVENASYGLTVCAERVAVWKMVADGCQEILEVAVVTKDGGSPCGACRQVLAEFTSAPENVTVTWADEGGRSQSAPLGDLLPAAFGAQR